MFLPMAATVPAAQKVLDAGDKKMDLASIANRGETLDLPLGEKLSERVDRLAALDRLDKQMERDLARGQQGDGDLSAIAGKAAEAGVNKNSAESMLGHLSSASQSILSAVRENSNWNKMLSTPTVQFTEMVKPNGKMLQTLNVTLNPVELGRVDLNLRLNQGQVTIEVKAESEQAYRALLVDQDALANTLRGLGFKVDAITVNGPASENGPQFQNSGPSDDGNSASGYEAGNSSKGQDPYDGADATNTPMTVSDEEAAAAYDVI